MDVDSNVTAHKIVKIYLFILEGQFQRGNELISLMLGQSGEPHAVGWLARVVENFRLYLGYSRKL